MDSEVALAAVNDQVRALQEIASDPEVLLTIGEDYLHTPTNYTVSDDAVTERAWSLIDRTYIAQVGAGRVITSRTERDHPAYWLVIKGRSDVWSVTGRYWLATALVSLAGFLLAAWLLSHMTWKGQRAYMIYERRRRETTAAIAHDLKTPLAVIRACAENMGEDIQPEKRTRYVWEIARQTEQMDRTLGNMLELSRLECRGPALRPEEVELRELAERLLEELSPLLTGLKVTSEVSGTLRADRAVLERLLGNLLRNALEHSDGLIRVEGDEKSLTVFNSGKPIPEEDLPRLWEPYFKGDAARKGGSGLGLAIVAAIAGACGWRCEAANSADGVRFTVHF